MTHLYWIKDDTCHDYNSHGYVGVSFDANRRHKAHIRGGKVHADTNVEILFEGDREACFLLEIMLRPKKGTGWNSAPGGIQGYVEGFVHSERPRRN